MAATCLELARLGAARGCREFLCRPREKGVDELASEDVVGAPRRAPPPAELGGAAARGAAEAGRDGGRPIVPGAGRPGRLPRGRGRPGR